MPLKQHSDKTHILGVGKSFFGIEQKDASPALDHYDFGIAGFNADEVTAKLRARNLKPEPPELRNRSNSWIPMDFLSN
jgi:hypothetical protein